MPQRMPRRRLMLIALATLLVAVGVGVWLAWPAATRITMANAGRIKKRMTLAEVEAILGGPARDELDCVLDVMGRSGTVLLAQETVRTGPLWRTTYTCRWKGLPPLTNTWISRSCHVDVQFDENGRVAEVFVDPVRARIEFGLFFLKK